MQECSVGARDMGEGKGQKIMNAILISQGNKVCVCVCVHTRMCMPILQISGEKKSEAVLREFKIN